MGQMDKIKSRIENYMEDKDIRDIRDIAEFLAGYNIEGSTKKNLNYFFNPAHTALAINDKIYLAIVPDQEEAGKGRKYAGDAVAIFAGTTAGVAHAGMELYILRGGYDLLKDKVSDVFGDKDISNGGDPTNKTILQTHKVPLNYDGEIKAATNVVEITDNGIQALSDTGTGVTGSVMGTGGDVDIIKPDTEAIHNATGRYARATADRLIYRPGLNDSSGGIGLSALTQE